VEYYLATYITLTEEWDDVKMDIKGKKKTHSKTENCFFLSSWTYIVGLYSNKKISFNGPIQHRILLYIYLHLQLLLPN